MFIVDTPQIAFKQPFRPSSQDLSIQNGTARGRDGYGTAHHPACARILPRTHHQVLATALERSATELRDPGPLRGIPRLHGVGAYTPATVGNATIGPRHLATWPRRPQGSTVPPDSNGSARRPDRGPSPGWAKPFPARWGYPSGAPLQIALVACLPPSFQTLPGLLPNTPATGWPDPGSRLVPAIRPIGHRAEPRKAADNPISFAAGIAVVEQVVGVRVFGASRSDKRRAVSFDQAMKLAFVSSKSFSRRWHRHVQTRIRSVAHLRLHRHVRKGHYSVLIGGTHRGIALG